LAGVATLIGWMGEAARLAERSIGPVVDLLIRLRLAQIFFVSGVLKAADFEHAIYLSIHEYPVSWMDPVMAAYLGIAIELGGSVLLAVGLATRLAAMAMLALSWVIQFNYVALDTNLFWAALFGWLRMSGALAWWLWEAVHIGFLVGLRNRISVMLDWFWAYLTFRSGTRLITGGEVQVQEPAAAPMPQSPDALSALPRVGAPFKHG
jgi:uncharacterized membrane protein YphA (DoxX/SURF4 family)